MAEQRIGIPEPGGDPLQGSVDARGIAVGQQQLAEASGIRSRAPGGQLPGAVIGDGLRGATSEHFQRLGAGPVNGQRMIVDDIEHDAGPAPRAVCKAGAGSEADRMRVGGDVDLSMKADRGFERWRQTAVEPATDDIAEHCTDQRQAGAFGQPQMREEVQCTSPARARPMLSSA